MSCFVKTCKNNRRLLPIDSTISFHKFPRDEEKFKLWLGKLGLSEFSNFSWKRTMLICSNHFEINDIIIKKKYRTLKRDAAPTLNLELDTSPPNKLRFSSRVRSPDKKLSAEFLSPPRISSSTDTSLEQSNVSLQPESLERRKYRLFPARNLFLSTDSNFDRFRKRFEEEHNYYASSTKTITIDKYKKLYIQQQKRVYSIRATLKKLKKKVDNLKNIIKDLKRKHILCPYAAEHCRSVKEI